MCVCVCVCIYTGHHISFYHTWYTDVRAVFYHTWYTDVIAVVSPGKQLLTHTKEPGRHGMLFGRHGMLFFFRVTHYSRSGRHGVLFSFSKRKKDTMPPWMRMMRSLVPGNVSWLLETLTRAPDCSLIALIVAPVCVCTRGSKMSCVVGSKMSCVVTWMTALWSCWSSLLCVGVHACMCVCACASESVRVYAHTHFFLCAYYMLSFCIITWQNNVVLKIISKGLNNRKKNSTSPVPRSFLNQFDRHFIET